MTRRGPSLVLRAPSPGARTRPAARRRAAAADAATEAYLGRLIAGDRAAIAAAFAGAPSIDDPFAGAVRGDAALDAFVAERHALARGARGAARRPARSRAPAAAPSSRRCCTCATTAATSICRSRSSATTRPTGGVRALRVYH